MTYTTEKARKAAIDAGYTVSAANTIIDLGKFEGEHVSTYYFWDLALDGGADYDDGELYGFELNAEEAKALDDPMARWFLLEESEQGFVRGDTARFLPDPSTSTEDDSDE